MSTETNSVFALIGNIPPDYHSCDLRRYFSIFIETEGFECFHFRHRPEGKNPAEKSPNEQVSSTSQKSKPKPKVKTCCIVKLQENKLKELTQTYHKKHWRDGKRRKIPLLCFISKIKISDKPETTNQTSQNHDPDSKGQDVSRSDLASFPELSPPHLMPNGNVGTPTKVFLELIKSCKLPPKIIGKLGLTFPKSTSRRIYSSVKLDYSTLYQGRHAAKTKHSRDAPPVPKPKNKPRDGDQESDEDKPRDEDQNLEDKPRDEDQILEEDKPRDEDQISEEDKPRDSDHVSEDSSDEQDETETDAADRQSDDEEQKQDSGSEQDGDDGEEWERHESLHDDPANYERNKQRSYEPELELVWEKGGPGLVWYTDEKYWRDQQGDFDEQEADDWDVDTSVYYDRYYGGDRDSRELVTMRQERRRRAGHHVDDDGVTGGKIGRFEQHTRGAGRRIMEQQGWTDGVGLGAGGGGRADALGNDGQTDRTGLGYHGEKLQRHGGRQRRRRRTDPDQVIISTVYDRPEDLEIPETDFRRTDHLTMTYRHKPPTANTHSLGK